MRVGFIGAGLMGHGMAACLLSAGHFVVVVAHRNRAPVEDLIGRGAAESVSVEALARESLDVVFACLPNSDVVENVVSRMGPLLEPGTIVIDATTAHPASTLALHARLAERRVHLVDAPITGGPTHAEAGTLTALVGAEDEVFERVRPLLETYARRILHMGGPGAGHTAKLLNNLVTNATSALLAEAYTVAREWGVDWEKLFRISTCPPMSRSKLAAPGPTSSSRYPAPRPAPR